ncbi:Enhancing lycopene biosynthesis protein 2 [Candidatus Providencia siddallii]|uniref:Glyoxalase n=1 Tax=Candidatus Providencia siddallii TaxID=1715285 RepID=A0A0M6W8P3_9GAMM|nr:Enhancing lycopene biosynthesis protein 2 [Candidatus Providencia siddallii]
MKSVAVILSGCGYLDGSEVHESVLTILALSVNNAKVCFFAPNVFQTVVINHIDNKLKKEYRNQIEESARISRGNILPISEANADNLDALIIPGGFGVVKNLCNFEEKGISCKINKNLLNLIQEMYKQKKPLGFICIAPVMLPKILKTKIKLTIGDNNEIISKIEKMGALHVKCNADDIIVDEKNLIVTTPAYMVSQSIFDINKGINKLVKKILDMS